MRAWQIKFFNLKPPIFFILNQNLETMEYAMLELYFYTLALLGLCVFLFWLYWRRQRFIRSPYLTRQIKMHSSALPKHTVKIHICEHAPCNYTHIKIAFLCDASYTLDTFLNIAQMYDWPIQTYVASEKLEKENDHKSQYASTLEKHQQFYLLADLAQLNPHLQALEFSQWVQMANQLAVGISAHIDIPDMDAALERAQELRQVLPKIRQYIHLKMVFTHSVPKKALLHTLSMQHHIDSIYARPNYLENCDAYYVHFGYQHRIRELDIYIIPAFWAFIQEEHSGDYDAIQHTFLRVCHAIQHIMDQFDARIFDPQQNLMDNSGYQKIYRNLCQNYAWHQKNLPCSAQDLRHILQQDFQNIWSVA